MKTQMKVGVILINKKKQILLIKEKYKKDEEYKWNIIKGTYDKFSETLLECAIREVHEEIGVHVKKLTLDRAYHYGEKENPKIIFIFVGLVNEKKIVFNFDNNENDESIIEAKWFTKKEFKLIKKKNLMASYIYESFDVVKNLDNLNNEVEFFKICF